MGIATFKAQGSIEEDMMEPGKRECAGVPIWIIHLNCGLGIHSDKSSALILNPRATVGMRYPPWWYMLPQGARLEQKYRTLVGTEQGK